MKHEPYMRGIPVSYREPFKIHKEPWLQYRPEGQTVLEIVQSVPDLPPLFMKQGVVCINGQEIHRELWAKVRPKAPSAQLPIAVTLHMPLRHGGGGSGGGSTAKSVVGIVAALALVIVTAGIASFGVAALGIAGGSFQALALAGAVGIAGSLAISALSAPPTNGDTGGGSFGAIQDDTNTDSKESASASGNTLRPGGAIPRVIGSRKVFPPLAGQPIVELVGDDEYVEAIFILNGPHALSDIRVDGSAIDTTTQDVVFDTREGWESDLPFSTFTRQGFTVTPNVEMSVHKVTLANQQVLQTQADPSKDIPVWHGFTARNSPDEIWIHLALPSGLSLNGTTQISVPFRLRARRVGTLVWQNFPEFHVSGLTLQQLRRAILIKWKAPEPTALVPGGTGGFTAAFTNVVTTSDPSLVDVLWQTDSQFGSSAFGALYSGVEATTTITNTNLFDNRIEFYLDETHFPKGQYEFQIKRGTYYQSSIFNAAAYTLSGTVFGLFGWFISGGTAIIPQSRSNVADKVGITRVISIWNQDPIIGSRFALIAMRARNRSLQNVSVQAAGYVQDWDGVGWNTWTTTSYPAAHYRDVLSGAENNDPLEDELRDDAGLVAWRTLCIAHNWTCDEIIDDMRTQDVLSLLASCGYAKPYQSDIYGVTVDNDRSADAPSQVFSRLNTTNVRFTRAFARVPAGFVITYRNDLLDDDQAQLTVYQRDPSIADISNLESVSYSGLITTAKVQARGQFDIDQANARATFYYADTDIESLNCRRGSLVALQHDIFTRFAGDARVISKRLGSPSTNVIGLNLDAELPILNELDMISMPDILAVPDMLNVGLQTGIAIRRNDGTISTHTLSNPTGSTSQITFSVPIIDAGNTIEGFNDNNHQYGCEVVSGPLSSVYRRLLIASIVPQDDLKATLVMVDEAPELVRF